MPKFALEHLEEIVGTIKFYKLVVDGSCLYDLFCKQIEHDANLSNQLKAILARMDDVANLRLLPDNKFRDITPSKEKIKEYEIKTRDLRVYLIKDSTGNIIFIGGKKNEQKKDFRRFRSLKKDYLSR